MPIPTGDSIKTAPRTLLRDTVASSLREAIMSGDLHPGERINDEEVRAWLGVSRTPIRDAVNELSRCGLLETAPNRYTRVASPTSTDATEALGVIGVLIVSSLRLFVDTISPEEAEHLEDLLNRATTQFETDDSENLGRTCTELLSRISKQINNEQLERIIEDRIWTLGFYVAASFNKEKTPADFLSFLEEARGQISQTEDRKRLINA